MSCCAASAGIVGNDLPIVASLDYHANLTPEMAKLATALVGYRTYPHIDMAVTGKRAVELLDRLLKEKRPVYRAYRQLDFLIPLVWQCTFIEPAKAIFDLVGELEAGEKSHNQGIVSVTHTPGFPPADIAQCGPALVVYGHDKEAVEAAADKLAQPSRRRRRPSTASCSIPTPQRCAPSSSRRRPRSRSCWPTCRTIPAPAARPTRSACWRP